MNEKIIEFIQSYALSRLDNVDNNGYLLKTVSYQFWASYEIINRLMDNPFEPANRVLEKFMIDMFAYRTNARTPETQLIFLVAQETAEELMYLLL